MRQPSYTIVVVGYEEDQPFLELQAVSLRVYLESIPRFVSSILVIDNSARTKINAARLSKLYGELTKCVNIIDAKYFGPLPDYSGWRRQQVLKLLAARAVDTDRYVILDAKNHLVSPLFRYHLESGDGRLMRSRLQCFREHPYARYIRNSCQYFLLPEYIADYFLPGATPFVVSTTMVRELVDYVELREARQFGEFFLAVQRTKPVSEFGLYGAYILFRLGRFDSTYQLDLDKPNSLTMWPTDKRLPQPLNRSQHIPFFGVHRRAFKSLDMRDKLLLAEFWYEKKLATSVESAFVFVESCARFYR